MKLTADEAKLVLPGLVQVDLLQLMRAEAAGRPLPSIIAAAQSGLVRYRRADPREQWKTYTQLLTDGWGDCEDLAAAVTAELHLAGDVGASIHVYLSNPARRTHHVVVWSDWWGFLDPSRTAGMGWNEL